jgi:hypothetical protein
MIEKLKLIQTKIRDECKERIFAVSGDMSKSIPVCIDRSSNFTILVFSEKVQILVIYENYQSRVNVAQFVLPNMPSEIPELFNEKVNNLKNRNTNEFDLTSQDRKFYGIQISCGIRGKRYFNGEENYESKMFKNFFPNVPLTVLVMVK